MNTIINSINLYLDPLRTSEPSRPTLSLIPQARQKMQFKQAKQNRFDLGTKHLFSLIGIGTEIATSKVIHNAKKADRYVFRNLLSKSYHSVSRVTHSMPIQNIRDARSLDKKQTINQKEINNFKVSIACNATSPLPQCCQLSN